MAAAIDLTNSPEAIHDQADAARKRLAELEAKAAEKDQAATEAEAASRDNRDEKKDEQLAVAELAARRRAERAHRDLEQARESYADLFAQEAALQKADKYERLIDEAKDNVEAIAAGVAAIIEAEAIVRETVQSFELLAETQARLAAELKRLADDPTLSLGQCSPLPLLDTKTLDQIRRCVADAFRERYGQDAQIQPGVHMWISPAW